MLKVEYTTRFKRDMKLANKRKKDMDALKKIMKQIEREEVLSPQLRDHCLVGNWKSHRGRAACSWCEDVCRWAYLIGRKWKK